MLYVCTYAGYTSYAVEKLIFIGILKCDSISVTISTSVSCLYQM